MPPSNSTPRIHYMELKARLGGSSQPIGLGWRIHYMELKESRYDRILHVTFFTRIHYMELKVQASLAACACVAHS